MSIANHEETSNTTYTLITANNPLSKEFYTDETGNVKKISSAQLKSGKSQRMYEPFSKLKDRLTNATSRQAICLGWHSIELSDDVPIYDQVTAKTKPGSIARTKDHYSFGNKQGIMMFDYDPNPNGSQCDCPMLLKALSDIDPNIKHCAHIIQQSLSAGVHKPNEQLIPNKGFHVFIPVRNASDIPRYGKTIFDRLLLAGHGYIALASNGAMLVRTIIDKTVFSPERLVFIAPPIIREESGLKYTPPQIQYFEGNVLDTELLHELSDEENKKLAELIDNKKIETQSASHAKQTEWKNNKVQELIQSGIPEAKASNTIDCTIQTDYMDLYGSFLLKFAHISKSVSVADVLKEPDRYNSKALADPIEDESYGHTTAKFYWNDGQPFIHSFAHGEQKYFLHESEQQNDFSTLIKNSVTDETDVTTWNHNENAVSSSRNAHETHETHDPIPDASERPCYQVFETKCGNDDKKLKTGVWYFCAKRDKNGNVSMCEEWVCSVLYIDAITRDTQENNFGRLLRFKNTLGRWRKWAMPMDLLKGSGDEMRGVLLSMGVRINPHRKDLLSSYLQSRIPQKKIFCAIQTGWHGDSYVLPDQSYGPNSDKVIFQSGECNPEEFTTSGTLEEWRTNIAMRALGNPLMVLGISSAFAGPLLAKCNAESGGIHFTGDSSTGKTTIIKAASSVWGGANYARSWRATANGIEGNAQLFNDGFFALDEISECEPREIAKIVYALGNGTGKQRASRTGAARSVARWRCAVLSSGERSIATAMDEGGIRSKAGQEVRLLNIPVDRKHGAFDDLKGYASGALLSDAIKQAASKHYGMPGREFLKQLTHDQRNFSEAFDYYKNEFTKQLSNKYPQEKRAITRFALIAMAGELATEYGITGWQKFDAMRAAAAGYNVWIAARESGNTEVNQIILAISDYIEKYGDTRFTELNDDVTRIIGERSGYWRDVAGTRQYLFNGSGLRLALRGFDFKRALNTLSEADVIPAGKPDDKGCKAQVIRIGSRTERLYPITIKD